MSERNRAELLNSALETMMASREIPQPAADPELRSLLRIASDLRELPAAGFKSRLRGKLQLSTTPQERQFAPPQRILGPAATENDYDMAIRESAAVPRFTPIDIKAATRDMPERSMRFLAQLNDTIVVISRSSQPSHWECHHGADELLYLIEGDADIVTLTDDGPVTSSVSQGSIFVCPDGLWHRILPHSPMSLLSATPADTEGGVEEPPVPRRRIGGAKRKPPLRKLQAYGVRDAMLTVPVLDISEETTGEQADAAYAPITEVGPLNIGTMRFRGQTPWERHPDADELLYVVDGEVEVTALTADGPMTAKLREGSMLVCPQGVWHRQRANNTVAMIFGTPTKTTEHSFEDDPRI